MEVGDDVKAKIQAGFKVASNLTVKFKKGAHDFSGREIPIKGEQTLNIVGDTNDMPKTVFSIDKAVSKNRFFMVNKGGKLSVEGVTMTGGYCDGAGSCLPPTENLSSYWSQYSHSLAREGGAIFCWKETTLILRRVRITHCSSSQYGGAMSLNEHSHATFTDVCLEGNETVGIILLIKLGLPVSAIGAITTTAPACRLAYRQCISHSTGSA